MPVVRGTSLVNYPGLVTELGADPIGLLKQAGIPPEAIGAQDVFVSIYAIAELLDRTTRATGTPDFGRRLASRQGIDILGPVGVAARTAGCVGDALLVFERFLGAYGPALGFNVRESSRPGEVFTEFQIREPGLAPGGHAQGMELSLGVTLQVLRFLLGAHYAPRSVHLTHQPLTPVADYERDYNCRARFGQASAGFTLRAADLARPLHRDELTHRIITRYLADLTARQHQVSQSVRALIRRLLPGGAAHLDTVAEQLGAHPKALQRQLAGEGTTLTALVDEVRRSTAHTLLADPSITLAHLTRELGYTEQAAFTRACRRWFGAGPQAYRLSVTGRQQ